MGGVSVAGSAGVLRQLAQHLYTVQTRQRERVVVAHSDCLAAAGESEARYRLGRSHDMERAPSRRGLKRGDCTRDKNRAGVTTQLHRAMTPDDRVVEGQRSGGHVADMTMADTLTAEVVGCYVVEERGYDSEEHRQELRSNNNIPVIPGRKNRKGEVGYDKIMRVLTKDSF